MSITVRRVVVPGLLLLLTALAFTSAGAQSADRAGRDPAGRDPAGWMLLLATDTTGQVTAGSRAALRDAVRAGLPLRVRWRIAWRGADGRPNAVEHLADAGFLTIYQEEVYAQLAPISRQRPDTTRIRLDVGGTWVGLLDSSGRLVNGFPGREGVIEQRVQIWWYAPASAAVAPL